MDKHEQIREGLRSLSSLHGPAPTILARVEEVSEKNATCILSDWETGITYYDVRLHPVIGGGESLTLYPAKDSWAIAARLENTEEWMVLACCTIDKWALKINDTTIEQDATGLLIQKQNDTLRQALDQDIDNLDQARKDFWRVIAQEIINHITTMGVVNTTGSAAAQTGKII